MRTPIFIAFLSILSYAFGALTPCTNGKDGWYKNGKFCYNFVEEISHPRTWDEAEEYCSTKLKAHLISVSTYSENTFFKNALVNEKVIKYPSAWIGLKASDFRWSFKWVDGTAYSYSNWKGYRTPATNSSNSCALVSTTTGEWYATDCSVQIRGFVCKKANDMIEPNPEPPVKEGNCPDEWYKFRGKYYKLFGNEAKDGGGMTFDNANQICSRLNSSLVSIHSQQEQDFLTARMGERTTNVWIGLKTNSTNWRAKHYWLDKSDLNFVNWASGEPSNPQKEPCVEMYSSENVAGKWNDVLCNKLLGYICEKEVDPNIPMPKNITTKACSHSFFQRYKSSCYYLETNVSDWQSADNICGYYGGKLASINNTFEQAYISFVLADVNASVWIGLSDTDQSKQGLFGWSDGWPVYYAKWAKDDPQPDTLYNRCVSLTNDRTWTVSNCTEKMQFLCKINDVNPPDVPTIVGTCPASNKTEWIDVGNMYCYHVENKNKEKWSGAVRQCATLAQNVTLASFRSAHELQLMRPYILDPNGSTGNLWIGLVQDNDGGYIWQDGTASDFVPWNNGEPKINKYDTCVEMLGQNMKYNNLGCEQSRGYICEAPKELECTSDEYCNGSNTVCDRIVKKCVCVDDDHEVKSGTGVNLTCKPKMWCSDHGHCAGNNTECNYRSNACVCLDGHEPVSGTGRTLECDTLSTISTTFSPIMECLKNFDCHGSNTKCKYNTCVCVNDNYVEDRSSGILRCEPKPECLVDSDCDGINSQCDHSRQKCLCKVGFVPDGITEGKKLSCIATEPHKKHRSFILKYLYFKYDDE